MHLAQNHLTSVCTCLATVICCHYYIVWPMTGTLLCKVVVANGIQLATQLWTLNPLLVRLIVPEVRSKLTGESWVECHSRQPFCKTLMYVHMYLYQWLRVPAFECGNVATVVFVQNVSVTKASVGWITVSELFKWWRSSWPKHSVQKLQHHAQKLAHVYTHLYYCT